MTRKLIIAEFILIGSLLSCATKSFNQHLDYQHPSISFIEKVDSIIINKMNVYNIPGLSIGIVRNDSILYTKGYGVVSINSKKKVTENSIFHTASVSKIFTALAIIRLIENGQLTLDKKIVDIIPEISYKDISIQKVTIKTLLNHTSGISDIKSYHWSNNNQADSSLKYFILKQDLELDFEPSAKYAYCNLGYDILGYVVEKISGITFDDYVKINILLPSQMKNSDFRYFMIPDSLKIYPHSKNWVTKNIYSPKNYPYTREHSPSSTLNASANELSKWMISFLQNLHTPGFGKNYQLMTQKSTDIYPYIGLGFQLGSIESKKTIGHFGGDTGFRSYLCMIPEEKIGIVILGNCDYNEDFRQEILHPIASLMLKVKE